MKETKEIKVTKPKKVKQENVKAAEVKTEPKIKKPRVKKVKEEVIVNIKKDIKPKIETVVVEKVTEVTEVKKENKVIKFFKNLINKFYDLIKR